MTTFEKAEPKLSTKARWMLENIVHNDYTDGREPEDIVIWSDCLDCGPHDEDELPRSSYGGLVATLIRKGLIWQDEGDGGHDRDGAVVGMTPAGCAYVRKHCIW